MKCIDCGCDFSDEKKEETLKVELNNPGIVMFKGKVSQCHGCGEKYTSESDIGELLQNFETEHKKQNSTFQNKSLVA